MLLLGLVASSTVEGDKNVSEKSRLVLEERVALQASQMALQASQMERMYAKILELEKRDAARTAEIDQLKAEILQLRSIIGANEEKNVLP